MARDSLSADAFRNGDVPIRVLSTAPPPPRRRYGLAGFAYSLVGRGFAPTPPVLEPHCSGRARVVVIPVELPYWKGPEEVLHIMSFLSLLDDDLALVYRRIMPVSLCEIFNERGVQLVDVSEAGVRHAGLQRSGAVTAQLVMVDGILYTIAIEAVGCSVREFDGSEICLPGAGGPTCLTRPLSGAVIRGRV